MKPIIAAVNGLAYGGGMEMLTNLDIVVAAKSATFALPEVKRGVVAMAGALPRIVRTIGRQRAMEMALTGRTVSTSEAFSWGLVNAITEDAPVDAAILSRPVVKKALEYAAMITENSPDSVIISREGIKWGWEGVGAEEASRILQEAWGRRLNEGENIKEGGESITSRLELGLITNEGLVRAFTEKRKPKWIPSKL
jgi:enoyl-CoA hydratase/carnithine racemase